MDQSLIYAETKQAQGKLRWQQLGAGMGIAFVVLQLAGQALIQVGGAEPEFNAQAAEIVAFFSNRDPGLAAAGSFLSVLSLIALTWFLGVLWAELRRHEGEPGWLSLVTFACGLVAIGISISGAGWELALTRLEDGLSPEMARYLFDQGNFGFANYWVALAGMLLATAVVTLRDGALRRWLGWFGLVTALSLLAARMVWFDASGAKFMPYMLFWIWLISASIVLIRRQGTNAP